MRRDDGFVGRRLGVLLLIAAALVFSMAGLFTRLILLDVWTLLFWRGLVAGVLLVAIEAARPGSGPARLVRGLRLPALGVAAASAAGTILYIQALRATTVADVAVIYAASPFVTALLVMLAFGERQTRSTVLASLAAVIGVAVMLGGALGGGHLWGDALALAMTLCMAAVMILIRRFPAVPMNGAIALSFLLTALVALPLAHPLAATPMQLGELALFGGQLALGAALLAVGGRAVPATEAALIGTLDAPLAPALVLLAFGEVPDWRTVLGGTIVMAGVVGHIGLGGRAAGDVAPASSRAA